MSKLRQVLFKSVPILLFFFALGVYGQKESKTFKETFKVGEEAVVNINTSHVDIEFETWDKNEVLVEATIELEGATAEEAKKYFENNPLKIMGSSSTIEISTKNTPSTIFTSANNDWGDFDIEIPNMEHFLLDIPELSEMPEIAEVMELAEIAPMPPLPAMPPMAKFDYKAYKKDGDKYLKKWKKEFDKSFDEDYQKKMEEWSERMDEKREELEIRRDEMREKREEEMEKRREALELRRDEMEARRDEMMVQRDAMREQQQALRNVQRSFFISRDNNEDSHPSIFYFSSDGEKKNYKVKKTIKIKMPKSVKLKMNVRHGEVKLAENTKNINATLTYSRLLGATIDGNATIINASYSPVSIQKWNHGKLKADYSEYVNLKQVKDLNMSGISSNITIDELLHTAFIKNNLGSLVINSVSNGFKNMNISVEHGEVKCNMPSAPFAITVTGTGSNLIAPTVLTLNRTKKNNTTVNKGYHISGDTNKSIVISSKYSKVVLDK
ncbi:hypothetical protein GGR42_002880 [Saonia flava]|uniref:Adhesin domain-containing protein n=1 Tax=Saonia flava TaxID=523696 RepID=A0A846R6I8_9FLAO|nr:hypothetical protein [Saonia flava]NJB72389.1 hypothetical protein [Saonia flava]